MAKVDIIFILIISSLMLIADARILSQNGANIVKFRVYVQEQNSGPNATVYEVARANITSTSPTSFGLVRVTDSPVTAGPDANSPKFGRAQGLVANTGFQVASATFACYTFVFTAGKYNGSTISIAGWKQLSPGNQENPIIGGTGAFRMVRGFTISDIYTSDATRNYVVLFYDINVWS